MTTTLWKGDRTREELIEDFQVLLKDKTTDIVDKLLEIKEQEMNTFESVYITDI